MKNKWMYTISCVSGAPATVQISLLRYMTFLKYNFFLSFLTCRVDPEISQLYSLQSSYKKNEYTRMYCLLSKPEVPLEISSYPHSSRCWIDTELIH